MRSIKGLLILFLLFGFSFGCVQIGKFAGKLLTGSTSDLNEASTQIRFIRNTYPPEANTTEAKYFDDWAEGRNVLAVTSFKREGAGMLKIDGTVNANGKPLPYVANGSYGIFTDDLSPQTIDIETSAGQQISFTVAPIETVKIKSINNGSGDVDLTKDLIIELDEPESSENKNMRAMLLMDVLGARGWVDIANFKATDKVVIPAQSFQHLPGVDPVMGDSYLKVERFKVTPHTGGGIGAAQVLSLSWDAVPVNVTNKVDQVRGIQVEGTIEDEDGSIDYIASKPNAFLGRPFTKGKKLALTSLTVRATKLTQNRTETTSSSSTSYHGSYSVRSTTTTVKSETRSFPELPELFWDNLIDSMYDDILATLNKNMSAEFIPVESVIQSPSYASLIPIDDEITEVEVTKSYKGTKPLLPTTFGAIIGSVSTTFASDRIDARLIDELNVDGLVAITIDLEMPWEERSLSPRMSFRITGAPNGYIYGPTVYAEGVISGNGVALDENREITMDLLNNIVRQDVLIAAFDQALQKLHLEEKNHNYEQIWAVQD